MSPDRLVLVASNRGPVTFVEENGDLVPRRGAGGLVTALIDAAHSSGGRWVAAAMTELDRKRAAETSDGRLDVLADDEKLRVRLLSFEPETYDRFYNGVSNRLLWFLHHYLWDVARWPRFGPETRRSWVAYRQVNRAFAEALAEEADGAAASVLLHDYHLSTVPAELRKLAPNTRIAYFHHIPFAGPDYMRLVPGWMRDDILRGLLGADLVGFQTKRWAEGFLQACRLLEGAIVDPRRRTVAWEGRPVRIGVYPISVDAAGLRSQAATPEVKRKRRAIARLVRDRRMVFRADRMEPSKNVLRGFLAYEDFLRRYPEWRGRVLFLAHLNPSRRELAEYRAYTEECLQAAGRINAELGDEDWNPIKLDIGDDYEQVLASMGLYDVLMVNSIFDGMNLVAKEGAVLNRNRGVILLSRHAGAIEEMQRFAVPVDPLDIGGTADALAQVLEMSDEERGHRAQGLRRAAARRTPAEWVEQQLADLDAAVQTPR